MIPRVGRENLVPPTPPPTARNPNLPSSTMKSSSGQRRRSSIGGANAGGDRRQSFVPPPSQPAKVDPRPTTDKAYQQDCIKQLLSFLQRSGYEYPVSHKSLSRPSGKDFNNIVTFMLRKVDPNFQDGTLKIEDEIAMNFKAMGYPFGVSKTALVAAGSPHTWPTLLAALTWLMMRVECMEKLIVEEDDAPKDHYESIEELDEKTDRCFFKYLSEAYTAFLKGDEDLQHNLQDQLAEALEQDDDILGRELERMTDRNAAIVERMNNLSIGEQE